MMNIIPTRYALLLLHAVMLLPCSRQQATNHAIRGTWPAHQAHQWQEKTGWLIGANFIPGTAINQLEMWQDETFDPTTIYRELEYAANLGFNATQVYLHDLLWKHDSIGFLDRIDYYLEIADGFGIQTMFVLFNGVWQQEAIDSSGLKQYPVVFSRYGEGTHPVINGSTASGGDHLCAILINNQDGIKLQSLEVTNDRRVSREGVNETWCRVKKNILETC